MAQAVMSLTIEMDLLFDAIGDIERIFGALSTCHGQKYRALERRIENLIGDDVALSDLKLRDLGIDRFIVEPPVEVTAIVRRARDLGVI